MTTRQLTNSGNPLTTPDGVPWAGVQITFTLVDAETKAPTAAWNTESGERVAGIVRTKTDTQGEFSLQLVPTDQLVPPVLYLCRTHGVADSFFAALESAAQPKQWLDFYAGGATLPLAYLLSQKPIRAVDTLLTDEQSNDFSQWSIDGTVTLTLNSIVAPDGALTAEKITETATSGGHYVYFVAANAGDVTIASLHIKKGTRRYVGIHVSDDVTARRFTALFDLDAGEFVATRKNNGPTSVEYSAEVLANGWFRLTAQCKNHTVGNPAICALVMSDSASPTWDAVSVPIYQGDTAHYCYLWGGQLQAW